MGFCIDGLKVDKNGKRLCFFSNIWYWHILASYVLYFAGDCLDADEKLFWHSNDRQYVSKKNARKLGKKLLKLIAAGHTKKCEEDVADTDCVFDTEVVKKFSQFCLSCNGFEIW